MENKNEITIVEMLTKAPQELVKQQSPQQRAQTYIAIDMINKALKEEERQSLLNGDIDKFEWELPNGLTKTLTIVKTEGREEDVVVKKIDYEKAIAYAKEHEFSIPMTEPQIDYIKLENQSWFQENVDKFVVKTIETKIVKPTKALKVK